MQCHISKIYRDFNICSLWYWLDMRFFFQNNANENVIDNSCSLQAAHLFLWCKCKRLLYRVEDKKITNYIIFRHIGVWIFSNILYWISLVFLKHSKNDCIEMHSKLPLYFLCGLRWSRWYLMINCMAVLKGGEQNLKERGYIFIIGVLFIIIISARLCIPSTNKSNWDFFSVTCYFHT